MTGAGASPLAQALGDAGALLPPACQEGFARVAKLIRARLGRFQLVLLDCRDERLRDRLIADLDVFVASSGGRVARLDLDREQHREFADVEAALQQLADAHEVIHICGGAGWFDAARWADFNIRREAVAREVKASLLFWVNEEAIAALARVAIDLWAWRAAVVTFASTPSPPSPPAADFREVDDRLAGKRERRVGFLREAALAPDLPDELRAELYVEMGDLLFHLGQPAPALRAYREALRETQDERSRAIMMDKITDVLEARGELDEALRIRREDVLPVFERFGDVRSRAVTMGKIADVLQARGELDETLRIRREEQLPVFDRLGDVRERAVTMGKIADVLQTRGELEEALRIRRDEQLPVYERLGDVRSRAVTLFKIALAEFDVKGEHAEVGHQTLALASEAFEICRGLGIPDGVAHTGLLLARVLAASGRDGEAEAVLEEARSAFAKLGDSDGLHQVGEVRRSLTHTP